MPPPTTQAIGGRSGGGRVASSGGISSGGSVRPHGIGKGLPGAALLEADMPSIKLKRIPGVVVPTVPAAANALTAAAAGLVGGVCGGGGGGSSVCGGAGGTSKSGQGRRGGPPRRLAFDFREPDPMEDFRSQRLRRKFHEKLGAKAGGKYELVAGFHLEDGVILSYQAFRMRVRFELTERRRKILTRYYRQGEQEVLLYVDRSEFEYYTPVPCYRPPPPPPPSRPPPTTHGLMRNMVANSCGRRPRRRDSALAAWCGCAG